MDSENIGISWALSAGWGAFKKYPGMAIGGSLLFMVIYMAGAMIPFANLAFIMFAAMPLMGGGVIFYLNMVRGTNPQIEDLFAGFKSYWKWMGVGWLYTAAIIAAELPVLIAFFVSGMYKYMDNKSPYGAMPPSPTAIIIMASALILSVVLMTVLSLRWFFVWFLAADGVETMEAFKRSAEMTKGWRLKLFGIQIVLGLCASVGVLACGIGKIFTSIIVYLAMTSIYVDLTSPKAETPATTE